MEGFGGGILLGGLADAGFLRFALMVPAIPLLIGVVLIGTSLPNKKKDKVEIDFSGIVCLAVLLSGFCLAMNYGPLIGLGKSESFGRVCSHSRCRNYFCKNGK